MMNSLGDIWAIREGYEPMAAEIMCRAFHGSDEAAKHGEGMNDQSAVAVIPIKGVLTQHSCWGNNCDEIGEWVDSAANDNAIKAIVLDIDSPGGSVFGVQETGEKIRQAREIKPVFAVVNSMMASAADWLGSQATRVVATPGADIGSVGVIMVHVDYSSFLENEGVKFSFITSSKYKAEGNFVEPLTDEARAHFQSRVDDYHTAFIEALAKGRGVSKSVVSNDFGQGRMFGAAEAKKRGMIDSIGTLESTISRLLPQPRRSKRMRMQSEMQRQAFSSCV